MRAERLPCTVCLPSLVLVTRAVFPFRARTHKHTKSQTPLVTLPTLSWVTINLAKGAFIIHITHFISPHLHVSSKRSLSNDPVRRGCDQSERSWSPIATPGYGTGSLGTVQFSSDKMQSDEMKRGDTNALLWTQDLKWLARNNALSLW